jgi:hypothetical protein
MRLAALRWVPSPAAERSQVNLKVDHRGNWGILADVAVGTH